MTKDEIDTMWQQAMQESIKDGEMFTRYHFAKLVAEKALAEHAMSEVQRLGQEIEQEPEEKFCDSNCVWTDHHSDCKLAQTEQIPPSADSNTHQPEERNYCPRCGKRTKDIHTCTPPRENT